MYRPKSFVDVVFGAILIWFGSYAHLFFFAHGGPKPLYSYIVLIAFATALLVLHMSRTRWSRFSIRSEAAMFVSAMLGYLAYGHFAYFYSSQSAHAVQAYITLVESVLIALSMMVILWHPRRIQLASVVMVVLGIGGTILNIWDFMLPAFSIVPGRAAGLYENPNMAGTFIVLAMVGSISAVPKRFRLAYVLVCGIGVLVTFSRGAWMTWFIGVLSLIVLRQLRLPNFSQVIVGLVLLSVSAVIFGGTLLDVASVVDQLSSSGLLTPNTAARLGIGGDVFSGFAAYDRLTVAFFAFDEFQDSLILGHGLGYATEWSYPSGPHNMYLLLAVEGGIVGLTVYFSLLLTLWIAGSNIGRAIVVLIVFSGLFSHNLLEQPPMLLIMAFVAVHGSFSRGHGSDAPLPMSSTNEFPELGDR